MGTMLLGGNKFKFENVILSSDKKKKKKKHGKKSKRSATDANSSSSSTESSSSEDERTLQPKKERVDEPSGGAIEKPANANSIRVTMRKQEAAPVSSVKPETHSHSVAPPPPVTKESARGKWTSAGGGGEEPVEGQKKRDEAIMQQWNTVQPVISESEKKFLEQLKGKLKNKPTREAEEHKSVAPHSASAADDKSRRPSSRRSRSPKRRSRSRSVSRGRSDRDRRDRDRDRDRHRDRERRRSRSRSRSRGRRRFSRSPMRSSRRSRSRDGRRRRSRSRSEERVERPVVKYSEFRPRTVPERKQEAKKEKKDTDGKPKVAKTTVTVAPGGKKLPFIGKMPVFKKQPVAATNFDPTAYTNGTFEAPPPPPPMVGPPGQMVARHAAPTAAQIQMAMMEDAFGNAPPFHPDAGMMMDYDELMPDPVQFANLMTSCPPPPPPGDGSDGENREKNEEESDGESGENDVLPPGIDEPETDLVARPLDSAAQPADGALPQDLAEALNIIFPSEGSAAEAADDSSQLPSVPQTVTTIVEDEPVLSEHNLHDLAKQGIHLVTIQEAEASKSANSSSKEPKKDKESPALNGKTEPQTKSLKQIEADDIPMPSSPPSGPPAKEVKNCEPVTNQTETLDIPEPKESLSESEKLRRQAELDELAMLGIDSSDMAAQCM